MGAQLGGSGPGQTVLSEINVTPFVDVMLVLLVIFMVATPIMTEEKLQREVEMDLPVTRENQEVVDLDQVDQIILSIDQNLRIFLGKTQLVDCSSHRDSEGGPERFEPCFDELQGLIQNNQRLQDDGRLYLLAHTEIPYGFVVGSMNRIRLAGVDKVGMVTNPEFQKVQDPE